MKFQITYKSPWKEKELSLSLNFWYLILIFCNPKIFQTMHFVRLNKDKFEFEVKTQFPSKWIALVYVLILYHSDLTIRSFAQQALAFVYNLIYFVGGGVFNIKVLEIEGTLQEKSCLLNELCINRPWWLYYLKSKLSSLSTICCWIKT